MAGQTAEQRRAEILSAVRGEMRHVHFRPEDADSDGMIRFVDDLARRDPDGGIGRWYLGASENQIKLFCRDWRRWREGARRRRQGGVCSCGGLRTISGGTDVRGRSDSFCLRCGRLADDDALLAVI